MPVYRKAQSNYAPAYGTFQPAHQYQAKDDLKAKESKLERCTRLCQCFTQLPNLASFFDFAELFHVIPGTATPTVMQLSMVACLLDISAGVPRETCFSIHGILPGHLTEWQKLADDGDPFYGKWFDFLSQAPFLAERSAISAMKIYWDGRSAMEWLRVNRPVWNVKTANGGMVYDPLEHLTQEQVMKELQELGTNIAAVSTNGAAT